MIFWFKFMLYLGIYVCVLVEFMWDYLFLQIYITSRKWGVTSQTLDIFVFSLAMLHDEDCGNRLHTIGTFNGIRVHYVA